MCSRAEAIPFTIQEIKYFVINFKDAEATSH